MNNGGKKQRRGPNEYGSSVIRGREGGREREGGRGGREREGERKEGGEGRGRIQINYSTCTIHARITCKKLKKELKAHKLHVQVYK